MDSTVVFGMCFMVAACFGAGGVLLGWHMSAQVREEANRQASSETTRLSGQLHTVLYERDCIRTIARCVMTANGTPQVEYLMRTRMHYLPGSNIDVLIGEMITSWAGQHPTLAKQHGIKATKVSK